MRTQWRRSAGLIEISLMAIKRNAVWCGLIAVGATLVVRTIAAQENASSRLACDRQRASSGKRTPRRSPRPGSSRIPGNPAQTLSRETVFSQRRILSRCQTETFGRKRSTVKLFDGNVRNIHNYVQSNLQIWQFSVIGRSMSSGRTGIECSDLSFCSSSFFTLIVG